MRTMAIALLMCVTAAWADPTPATAKSAVTRVGDLNWTACETKIDLPDGGSLDFHYARTYVETRHDRPMVHALQARIEPAHRDPSRDRYSIDLIHYQVHDDEGRISKSRSTDHVDMLPGQYEMPPQAMSFRSFQDGYWYSGGGDSYDVATEIVLRNQGRLVYRGKLNTQPGQ